MHAQVLAWFEHNAPVVDATGEAPRDYAAEAQALACQLLEEQCGTVAWLLAGFTWVRAAMQGCQPMRLVVCSRPAH